MNFTTAAFAAAAAFVLSFLMGLIGGVPFLDILLRALLWGAVGFGACLGIETLLRNVLPDLFEAAPAPAPAEEAEAPAAGPDRVVDIIVEDEVLPPRREPPAPAAEAAPGPPSAPAPEAAEVVPLPPQPGDEEMPEIGSFLDAFKPGAPDAPADSEAAASPEIGEYAPSQWAASPSPDSRAPAEAGEDPAVLAKAVQTVMKRDGQGN